MIAGSDGDSGPGLPARRHREDRGGMTARPSPYCSGDRPVFNVPHVRPSVPSRRNIMKKFMSGLLLPALALALLLPAGASAQGRKPKITVIGTGGTIAG